MLKSSCTIVAFACVVLSCSGRHAEAFALCNGCPDLFAKTPAPATAAPTEAPPRRRVQHARFHERSARRRLSHEAARFNLADASRKALDSNAAAETLVAARRPAGGESIAADHRQPTPAARIDELFNLLGAEPSDDPDAMTSFRREALRRDPASTQPTILRSADAEEARADLQTTDRWWVVRFVGVTLALTAVFSTSGPTLWRLFARLPIPGPTRARLRRALPLRRLPRTGARRLLTSQRLVG